MRGASCAMGAALLIGAAASWQLSACFLPEFRAGDFTQPDGGIDGALGGGGGEGGDGGGDQGGGQGGSAQGGGGQGGASQGGAAPGGAGGG